jgi:heptosyltransferase-2
VTEPALLLHGPLVVRSPNWLGDAVMALPAVRNLKTMLVDDPITVAAPEKLAALWQKCPFVDQVIALDKP